MRNKERWGAGVWKEVKGEVQLLPVRETARKLPETEHLIYTNRQSPAICYMTM